MELHDARILRLISPPGLPEGYQPQSEEIYSWCRWYQWKDPASKVLLYWLRNVLYSLVCFGQAVLVEQSLCWPLLYARHW